MKSTWNVTFKHGGRAHDLSWHVLDGVDFDQVLAWAAERRSDYIGDGDIDGEVFFTIERGRASRDLLVATLVREVLCEQIFRRKDDFDFEHPNSALGLRDLPLSQLLEYVPEKSLSKQEWRALASKALDKLLVHLSLQGLVAQPEQKQSPPENFTLVPDSLEPSYPIPPYGRLYALEDFVQACKAGSFNDQDGEGNYATTERYYARLFANPSAIVSNKIDRRFTHVMWFNK